MCASACVSKVCVYYLPVDRHVCVGGFLHVFVRHVLQYVFTCVYSMLESICILYILGVSILELSLSTIFNV